MTLSPEQLEDRLGGITGTDVGAIIGLNPWKTPLQVWLEKTGQTKSFEGNVRTRWGNLLEPLIRSDYEQRHDVRVEVPGTLTRPDVDWWKGSPDGLVYRHASADPERGLEIKVHGRDAVISGALVYGAPGTDEIPPHETIQDQWYMGATGLRRWDHVVFLDGAPVEYMVERDDELIGMLGERAEKFLIDHVRKRVPPPPDGTADYDRWLATRWSKTTPDLAELGIEHPMLALVHELREIRASGRSLEAREKEIKQELKAFIGDREGLTWVEVGAKKPPKMTWKFSAASTEIDWPAIVAHHTSNAQTVLSAHGGTIAAMLATFAAEPAGLTAFTVDQLAAVIRDAYTTLVEVAGDDVVKAYTKTIPGPRVFNVPRSWSKDEATNSKEN